MISINALQNRSIAIFGTGKDAVKCAYNLCAQGISIESFFNNNKKINTFMGYSVHEPTTKYMTRGIYIVIAVGRISTYLELAGQLNELGLVEFDDYIYYKWLDKKLVLLHGNCHMHIIKSYLESSNKFAEKYEFYPNPLICNNKEGKIADKVFDYCDLWIHEDIQEDNEYGYLLSDVYIRGKWLGGGNYNKKEIIIPHLFGMGNAFFPQAAWNRRNEAINNAKEKNGMFPHADIIIDKCVEKGMKVEDIIAFCKGDSALERNVIIDNFNPRWV